jgi:hypothetical protein
MCEHNYRRRHHHLIGRGHEKEPLADYALFTTTFLTLMGCALVPPERGNSKLSKLSERIPLSDAVLLGMATARLSRLVTREKIMRVVRAPFTEVEEGASLDEVKERPRGHGFVRAMGELLTCPRCFGMWASAGLSIAYYSAPALTRAASGVLAVALINDFINLRFARTRELSLFHHASMTIATRQSTMDPHPVEKTTSSSGSFRK